MKIKNKKNNLVLGIYLWILFVIGMFLILFAPVYLIAKAGFGIVYRFLALLISLSIIIIFIAFFTSTKFAKKRWVEFQTEWMKQDQKLNIFDLMIKIFFSLLFLQLFMKFIEDNIYIGLLGLFVGWAIGYFILKLIKRLK
mgnify:CR=1 FL=1